MFMNAYEEMLADKAVAYVSYPSANTDATYILWLMLISVSELFPVLDQNCTIRITYISNSPHIMAIELFKNIHICDIKITHARM